MRALLPLMLVGCTTAIHQATVSDTRPFGAHGDSRMVEAYAEQFTIMGFDADNTHVDEAWEDLQQECGLGTLTAIVTETSTALGFFSWTNKIQFRALCVTTPEPVEEEPVEAEELSEEEKARDEASKPTP